MTKNRPTSKKIYNWGLHYHEEENRNIDYSNLNLPLYNAIYVSREQQGICIL